MSADRRRDDRIAFERGFPAMMTSLDGKWRMPCAMDDVSDNGAKLRVKDSVEGVNLKEFILVLSANGQAYRRCELSWVKGSEIGVRFIKAERKKRSPTKAAVPAKPAPVVEV